MIELDIFKLVEDLRQKELEHLAKETDYFELKQYKAKLEKEKAFIEEAYSSKVAFDKELKNAEQRKAKLFELLKEDVAYQQILEKLENLDEQLTQALTELKKAKIEVNYYQNLIMMVKTSVDATKSEAFNEFINAITTAMNSN